ncbi:MAG: serine/threonine protein kinase [Phycisphaerae bacterium]|nr:serine/threonine protein kinase [Phycisphaerae bacterium]
MDQAVTCRLTEEELWSGLDRNAPEILEHVENCPTCQERAGSLRATIAAVASASEPEVCPIPQRIGPYLIQRRLGLGGMGIVYEGEQENPRRLVAVKVVRGGHYVDDYRVRLFQREVETLARLKHPAIAAIYEAGRTADGQHYFAMELVRGMRLNDYVLDRHVPLRQRLELFMKICDAINYAHQRGVIHRDIKPSNILVDAEGNPKILDFGLARITDSEMGATTTGSLVGRIMGTLPYMSPEEARGNPDEIDVRGDVYSLGVILYEMLTGSLPYTVSRQAIPEAIRVICEEVPRRPSQFDRSLRGDLETIILKSLEKERARRYQSPAALAEDVGRFLRNEPILARRTSTLYLTRKFVQRHSIVVALIVLMIAAGAFVQYMSERVQTEANNAALVNSMFNDLATAASFEELARDSRSVGQPEVLDRAAALDRSARLYREALHTYERIVDEGPESVANTARQRLGGVKLGLGQTLIVRGVTAQANARPSAPDFDEAKRLIKDGLDLYEEYKLAIPEAEAGSIISALRMLRRLEEANPPAGDMAEFRDDADLNEAGDFAEGPPAPGGSAPVPEEGGASEPGGDAAANDLLPPAGDLEQAFNLGEIDAMIRRVASLSGQEVPELHTSGTLQ